MRKENLEGTIQEELEAASQKVIRLTRIAEQAAYYEALLHTADQYTQEADRALQALQNSPLDAQLRGRERIRQRSRIL